MTRSELDCLAKGLRQFMLEHNSRLTPVERDAIEKVEMMLEFPPDVYGVSEPSTFGNEIDLEVVNGTQPVELEDVRSCSNCRECKRVAEARGLWCVMLNKKIDSFQQCCSYWRWWNS